MLHTRTSVNPSAAPWRRLALILGLLMALLLLLGCPVPPQVGASAADLHTHETPLILLHGYEDSCENAFNALNSTYTGNGPFATTTLAYLRAHGWTTLLPMGYYNATVVSSNGTSDRSSALCGPGTSPDTYLPDAPGVASQCNAPGTWDASTFGTVNDPIQHLACELAWFIFARYTVHGQPVAVLAHSMGGLLIRDALGQSGPGPNHDSHFPLFPLLVNRVVTVGTPDGLTGSYFSLPASYTDTQELNDMNASSAFMQTIQLLGKPRGLGGTFWGLIGASDPAAALTSTGCPSLGTAGVPTGSIISCLVQLLGANGAFPDGDGIAPAQAMMAFPADYKILYGGLGQYPTPMVADLSTAYEHEANWCFTPTACLNAPFYLTDGARATTWTRAWICSYDCDQSDLSDLNIGSDTARPALHALAEITWLLAQ